MDKSSDFKKTNVLLISKKTEQAQMLLETLSRTASYNVRFEETAEAAMDLLTSGAVDCIVINFEHFGFVQIELIHGIRQIAKISQVLILTDKVDEAAVIAIKDEAALILIEKPLINMEKDIGGLCKRLLGTKATFKRELKRHQTMQKATVTFLESGRVAEAKVEDISEAGACLEIKTNFLKLGDKIKISIQLDQLGRNRVVQGEIRWGKKVPGRALVGVKFFKA